MDIRDAVFVAEKLLVVDSDGRDCATEVREEHVSVVWDVPYAGAGIVDSIKYEAVTACV